MAIQWDKYHVCIKRGKLRIGRGSISGSGVLNIDTYSDDRTSEIASVVAAKMKMDLDKRDDSRGYVGYDIPYIGKLILVSPDYEFEVKKKSKERQKKH
jgi:hypothetical protein